MLPRLLIKRRLPRLWMWTASTRSSPVDVDSTDTVRYASSRWIPNGEEQFKFESQVVGGAIPKEYIPAVGEGIEEAAQSGILGGLFPVLGVHAIVYDGSYHEVDSSEMAFHIAGSMAFKDAMQKANPVLLEPIMKVEVTTPEITWATSSAISTAAAAASRVWTTSAEARDPRICSAGRDVRILHRLRSKTQGRGNYSCSSRNTSRFRRISRRKYLQLRNKQFSSGFR